MKTPYRGSIFLGIGGTSVVMKKAVRHEKFLKLVGENIREAREKKGYSQRELSDITDTGKNQLGRIERGEVNARISTLYEIASILEMDVRDFFKKRK